MTVAPVVVRPETDSNTASASGRSGLSLRSSGMLPVRPSASQNPTTMTKPSRSLRSPRERRTGNHSAAPAPTTSSMETMNGGADGSS